ncbi:MAG: Rho termination factor N-terminal domain-containing protein, partial [Bacteroidales bacterium]
MYDIIELSSKSMEELHRIANALEIKKVESIAKNELIYQILDIQAESGASASSSGTSNTKKQTSRRTRKPQPKPAAVEGKEKQPQKAAEIFQETVKSGVGTREPVKALPKDRPGRPEQKRNPDPNKDKAQGPGQHTVKAAGTASV